MRLHGCRVWGVGRGRGDRFLVRRFRSLDYVVLVVRWVGAVVGSAFVGASAAVGVHKSCPEDLIWEFVRTIATLRWIAKLNKYCTTVMFIFNLELYVHCRHSY